MKKEKLTIEQQVEYMRDESGIQFNIVTEDEAVTFLRDNSYYFKVKAFAKNYEKYTEGKNSGKYINLEFAYLQELSTLDMYFRRLILKMTLDIEHYLKTQLLRDSSQNTKEDGYTIIEEFYKRYPYVKEKEEWIDQNSASSDLFTKYKDNFAIWNIVEVLSFGDFTKLYSMYYNKYNTKGSMEKHLWSVRFLRNAAAHNNCLLNTLRTPYSKKIRPNHRVLNFISGIDGISRESRKDKMKNPVIHDFVVSLYVFNNVVTSEGIKRHAMLELKDSVDNRMVRGKEYFQENQLIVSYYGFLKIIIDYFYELSI